jgi:hypothetical protein
MPAQRDPDLPDAYIVHQVAGRMRLRVPARRRDGSYFANVMRLLAVVPDVRSVRVSPSTGSVLVHHAGPPEAVAERAREAGLFRLTAASPALPRRRPQIGPKLQIAPLSIVAAGLAGLGLVQLIRLRVAGSATEHLWAAYQASHTLGTPGLVATLATVGAMQLLRGRVLSPAVSLLSYALTARAFARRNARHR